MDPMLVKAVVWRESRFDPRKFGSRRRARADADDGRRRAANGRRKIACENFQVEELFDPKVNVQAGTWYLARAIQHWKSQADPVPFALAEYNAGASRAQRWAGGDDDVVIPPDTFRGNIDFPGTRDYVETIMARRDFYKRRGRM